MSYISTAQSPRGSSGHGLGTEAPHQHEGRTALAESLPLAVLSRPYVLGTGSHSDLAGVSLVVPFTWGPVNWR